MTIIKSLLPITLILTLANTIDAASYCGHNFANAKSRCDTPCDRVGMDTVNCGAGEYCFGPTLDCTPSGAVTADGQDDGEGGMKQRPAAVAEQGANDARPAVMTLQAAAASAGSRPTTEISVSSMNETTIGDETTVEEGNTDATSTTINGKKNTTTDEEENDMMQFTALSAQNIQFADTPEDGETDTPTQSPSGHPTSGTPTSNPIVVTTNAPTNAPIVITNAPSASPTTLAGKYVEERRGVFNPGNHFCGTNWDQAKNDCNTNPNAIPCPGGLPCLEGQLCFAMATMCEPVTFSPTLSPSANPTTMEPTTGEPTSSPITSSDKVNHYFCGSDENDANARCGVWCRYGSDEECPENQSCWLNTGCNATAMNFTSSPTTSSPTVSPSIEPTGSPSSPQPTADLNPNDYYCSSEWKDSSWEGECGMPCPSGQFTDCPSGMYCYGGLTQCIKTHKVNVSLSWCGTDSDAAADTCHQECPSGTDDECPDGESCWGDSPCALLDSKIEAMAAQAANLWCGTNYKMLVEQCPKRCEGGTDDECGKDADGNDMICFDMSTEETVCNMTGVGIKEPTDPDNLWCGTSWNHVLENCPKKCPEGTNEECGAGEQCFDLTGNEPMICKTEGFGVKKKADPTKRFCGDTYNQMMEFCPQRCPDGNCPNGMMCYEESPCELEGQSAPGFVKMDASKMFCGSSYGDATSCGDPCPSGSNTECPTGTTCWAEVECGWGIQPQSQSMMKDESSNMVVEVTVEIEGDEDANDEEPAPAPAPEEPAPASPEEPKPVPAEPEPQPQPAPAPEEPQPEPVSTSEETTPEAKETTPEASKPESTPADEPKDPPPAPQPVDEPNPPVKANPPPAAGKPNPPAPQPEPESSPAEQKDTPPAPQPMEESTPPAAKESNPPPAESSNPPPAESSNPPPAESSNPPPAESSNPPPAPAVAAAKPATESKPAPVAEADPASGIAVENVRMALYGITQLSAAQLVAWEDITADYVESFYNDASNTGDSIRDSVSDVSAQFDVTSLNLSAGRRSLRAAQKESRHLNEDAYLLTYTQLTQYYTDEDVAIEKVIQHPFQSGEKRANYVSFLKEADPELFGDLTSVSAIFLPDPFVSSQVPAADSGGSSSGPAATGGGSGYSGSGNPFGEVTPASSPGKGGVFGKNFYCHNSGEACPSGDCPDNDLCIFVPDTAGTPIAPFNGGNSAPADSAANLVSSVLSGSFVQPPAESNVNPPPTPPTPSVGASNSNSQPRPPTPSIATNPRPNPPTMAMMSQPVPQQSQQSQSAPVANNPRPTPQISVTVSSPNINQNQQLSSSTYGPITVPALEMSLYGINLRSARQIFEWQYLTAIYEQQFYNDSPETNDDIQNHVFAFATALEVTEMAYDEEPLSVTRSAVRPVTILTFKQTSNYKTVDPTISILDIVMQPFATPEYRDGYVKFLKQHLGETFGVLESVPSVTQTGSSQPPVAFIDTFFCSSQFPVDCSVAKSCSNDSECEGNQECLIDASCVATNAGQQQPLQQQTAPVLQQSTPVQQSRPVQPQQKPSTPVQQQQQSSPQSSPSQVSNISPYYDACNLCSPNQVGVNNPINFNGRLTDCAEAYDYMAKNYNEDESNCRAAKQALSGTCCRDQGTSGGMQSQSAPLYPTLSAGSGPAGSLGGQPTSSSGGQRPTTVQVNSPVPNSGQSTPTAAGNNDGSPTKITVTVSLGDDPNIAESSLADSAPTVDMIYPSNTYYCGKSLEEAANSCSIACPDGKDGTCPGDLQCFGNTECMNRESFYCGASWLDASDTCSKPCPNGDALECEQGEACFAWTSCQNTESFYCGVSFEDASSNCDLPCSSRSSLDCPEGQGCFAYTTCEETKPGPHETDANHVPMNDYFCGESKELAASTCSIACQGGSDSECPENMQCYEGTGCSSRDSFWCGPDWLKAADQCSQPCSSGSSDACPGTESCYAHTGCQHTTNLFWCGDSHEEASQTCSTPCDSRSSEQCPGSQLCFAFVTACASAPTQVDTVQDYSFGIANTQWEFDGASTEGSDGSAGASGEQNAGGPEWYTTWENDVHSSSSMQAVAYPIMTVMTCFSLLLLYAAM